jgi:DNA mismatch endonuclease (patch repair protein)
MVGNSQRETAPEIALRSALHRMGFRFRKHTRAEPSVRCRADIVFSRERVAVFVDGCFWHCCPDHGTSPRTNSSYWSAKLARNAERDRDNTAALIAAGWTVLRFWEHEDPMVAAERIAETVAARR